MHPNLSSPTNGTTTLPNTQTKYTSQMIDDAFCVKMLEDAH